MKFDILSAVKDFGKSMAGTNPNASVSERLAGGFGGLKKFGSYKKKKSVGAAGNAAADAVKETVAETVVARDPIKETITAETVVADNDPVTTKRKRSIYQTMNSGEHY